MQVLLLATDENPTLQPLSESLPAPLIPVVNRPLMELSIEMLAKAGYKQLFVSLFHRAGMIVSHFGDGRRWGVDINYVMQRDAWGNAGAIRWIGKAITETLLVLPANIILDFDVEQALSEHRDSGALLTLIHARSKKPSQHTIQSNDERGVAAADEKSAGSEVCEFTGAFFCEPKFIEYITSFFFNVDSNISSIVSGASERVHNYISDGYYNRLTNLLEYEEAQRVFLYSSFPHIREDKKELADLPTLRSFSVTGNQIAPGIWVGLNTLIHPNARLAPPVFIGEGCRIGADVELGPAAVIASSVVIDNDATVQHSTILRRSYIGQLVNINRRIVHQAKMIDVQTGASIEVTDKFLISVAAVPRLSYEKIARATDIFFSLVIMGLLLPVFVLTCLLVLIFIQRKIFVTKQHRNDFLSQSNSAVNILAFETKTKQGEINAVGRFIQFWGVERLPELLNVLRGDMRLVGLTPLSTSEYAYAEKNWQQQRTQYSIGFTGLWYIQSKQHSSLDEKIVADAYYMATRTFKDDLEILLKTPITWFAHRIISAEKSVDVQEYFG